MRPRIPQLRRPTILAAAAAAVTLLPLPARAQVTRYYVGNGADWNTPASWSDSPNGPPGATVPASGDTASLSASSNLTVPFDATYGSPGLAALYLDATTPGATLTLSQTAASTLYAATGYIGNAGSAAFVQTAGADTFSKPVYLGWQAGSFGSYSLSGAGVLSADTVDVGCSGGGSFAQTGGTNSVSFNLSLGVSAGAAGSYSLSGADASLVSGHEQYVGYNGSGTFTQAGGSNHVGGTLYLGYTASATGSYVLSDGALYANSVTVAAGSFVQTGGTHTVASMLFLPKPTASYTLAGTGSLSSVYEELGPGTFVQTGGTHTVSNYLHVSSGSYALSDTGALSARSSEYVADGFAAHFTQTGGTHTVAGTLYVGYVGGAGTYSLSGAGALLNVAGEDVGENAPGTFVQTGGTNVAVSLRLGQASGSSGTYSLSGTGTLSTRNELVANYGPGTFVQTGGSNTVAETLQIDSPYGVTGTYSLSGTGALSSNLLYAGYFGHGTFSQSGGSNAVSTDLRIGYASGATGAYALSGGSLSASNVYAGGPRGGSGALLISGGSATVSSTLNLNSFGGTYLDLSGGSLSVGKVVASFTPLNVSGGTLTAGSIDGGALALTASTPSAVARVLLDPAGPTSRFNSLSITHVAGGSALLDLADNNLVIEYYTGIPSPIGAVRSYLLSARNNTGKWDGTNGITSSAAAADPESRAAIAYAEAASLLNLTGTQTAKWSGQTVDATTLLLKYTVYGDANLDGKVNADDYALVDRAYARSLTDAHWTDGDFNYDGIVNSQDYLLIDSTYLRQQGGSPSPAFLSQRESQFGSEYVSALLTSVPEPSSLACLFAGCLLPRRRSRR